MSLRQPVVVCNHRPARRPVSHDVVLTMTAYLERNPRYPPTGSRVRSGEAYRATPGGNRRARGTARFASGTQAALPGTVLEKAVTGSPVRWPVSRSQPACARTRAGRTGRRGCRSASFFLTRMSTLMPGAGRLGTGRRVAQHIVVAGFGIDALERVGKVIRVHGRDAPRRLGQRAKPALRPSQVKSHSAEPTCSSMSDPLPVPANRACRTWRSRGSPLAPTREVGNQLSIGGGTRTPLDHRIVRAQEGA